MQFVCEFALENAKNSVLELHNCKNFLGEDPQTPPPKKTSDASLRPWWIHEITCSLSTIRENSGLYSFDSEFWGGGIENLKNLGGGHRKFTNNLNRGPVKIWLFFKTSSSPPTPTRHNKCTFPNISIVKKVFPDQHKQIQNFSTKMSKTSYFLIANVTKA
jgi:hypothetical protein